MSTSYATGKYAIAICDRCGCRAKYKELRAQVVNGERTNLRVCPDCLDVDHPQLRLNRIRIDDPQALRFPRPEFDIISQRALYSGLSSASAAGLVGELTPQIT